MSCENNIITHVMLPMFQMAMVWTNTTFGTEPTAKKACPGTLQEARTLHRAKLDKEIWDMG